MGLTSGSFLALMSGAAACWAAVTVLVWPRLAPRRRSLPAHRGAWPVAGVRAGRTAASLAARIGLLAVGQALVVAAFLVWLNSYFAFYGSWGQLLGQRVPPVAQQSPSPRLSKVGAVPAGAPPRPLPAEIRYYGGVLGPAPGQQGLVPSVTSPGPGLRHFRALPGAAQYGEILRVQIRGLRTGLTVSGGYIYLPPQYFRPTYARALFPAVLALTGYPGGANSIIEHLGMPGTAASLVAAGRAKPAVYVMLNVSPQFPRDTECTNVPAGPQSASFFAVDVPLAIEQAFRVTPSRAGWGTLGYSTGGYCAVKLAMMYPSRFAAAVSMAGYYTAVRDPTTGALYGFSAYRNENDLEWRLRHLPAPPVSVLVTTSRTGEITYPGTLRFLRLIRPPMHGYAYILPVGGHNFTVWAEELPQALQWMSSRLLAAGQPSAPPTHLAGLTA